MERYVLAAHDVSCVGRCSLTVALPVLQAAGCQCAVLPTAVLSSQTGGIEGYTYRDLTGDIPGMEDHWETLGLGFGCIYTGFLGSSEQVDLMLDVIRRFGSGARIVVDPVMADFGELYGTFGRDFPSKMLSLCRKADIIVPNMTEAYLLLGEEYREGPYSKEEVSRILRRLSSEGPRGVVLTGVYTDGDSIGAATYDRTSDAVRFHMAPAVEGTYHGSGDLLSSALVGAVEAGRDLADAADIAVRFTQRSVLSTFEAGQDPRFGLLFERNLPGYMRDIGALRCSYRPSLRK